MSESNYTLQDLPINMIQPNPDSLRKVEEKGEIFARMVDSMKEDGVLNAIKVSKEQIVDPETKEVKTVFFIIDGLHRWTAARAAGLDVMPCMVVESADQKKILMQQIVGNAIKVETKPVEYARQLVAILNLDRSLTRKDLAAQLSTTPEWIDARLGLVNLVQSIGDMVDAGELPLSNAYLLAKLPSDMQLDHLAEAQIQTNEEFAKHIKATLKEIRDARNEGREVRTEFVATPKFRSRNEIDQAMVDLSIARNETSSITDPVEAFQAALRWVLKLDVNSINAAKAKFESLQQEKNEKAEERKKEAAKKAVERAEKARIKAEELEAKAAANKAAAAEKLEAAKAAAATEATSN